MYGTAVTLETRHDAHESVDKAKRYAQIKAAMWRPMTAKEVAVEMHIRGEIPTSERNFTAPRLTEMSKMGTVEPVGKTRCQYTGKTVTVYALRESA